MGTRLGALLCPDPPRRIPAQRALNIALRTAHLMTFGALVGGHVFAVDRDRLVPFLVATIASGAALVALELLSTCAWLTMGQGVAVLVKLVVLATIPFLWDFRVPLLLLTIAIASVGAHMPAWLRHYSLLERRTIDLPEKPDRLPAVRRR